ncbi:MAG TPA: cystathionine beta-lyase [Lachnospiraceae bacterium]|uniref:trans-sulfuration enzyme family protein n=1 Tax=Anaerosporobacter sp. TaxID=1872529 RepID=UPI000ECD7D43|nr:PLP-dependent aspartate aminotransferase family protein [Anaerosporobacter sp.]HAB61538.1 cystathionine beta-lyase [Lachnospiraceae bacterium]
MKNFSNYNDFSRKEDLHFESRAVHGALGNDPITGAVSFPIYQTSTFRHKALGQSTGFDYSRLQNPTRQELERTMAILEEGFEGFAFTSGQAANMAVFMTLNEGDEVLLTDDIYGGTYRIGEDIYRRYGADFKYVDMSNVEDVRAAVTEKTKIIFIETPTNPMMKVADIEEISKIAKTVGAITVVDNTFLSPYFQKPLTLGADIVVHSGTKFIGGHNDALAGIVVVKTPEMAEFIRGQIKTQGNMLAPFDSWLLLRGIKTLPLRMERHNENAMKVANWLRTQPKVTKVYYVGFEDHINYDVTKKQTSGFGGMISFNVDSLETVEKLLSKLDMIMFAESLGGTETLITYPRTQTHESLTEETRQKLGITESFLRLSVGLEHVDDIIKDLDQALNG